VLYYHLIFVLKETHLAGTASLLTQSYRNGNIIQISRQVLVIFFLVLFVSSPAQSQTGPLIKLIEVNGNKKISTNTILSKLSGREGDSFSKNSVQDDIKSLYKIGYFDDVSVDIEPYEGGVKLIYNLVEKPSITSIDFQGNDEFETDKLKEQITLTLGAIANLPLIADNAKSLISFYQSEGYWLAKVIPIIREISADAVALTYQVDEGPKVKVKKVTIEGNNALSDRKIKKVMQTKKWWLFSFLTGSGIYKRDQMKDDVERIRDLYHSIGYIYVVISEPKIELSPDRKKLYIAMTVSERDQYSVGDITVQGNAVFSESDLLKDLEIASGQIFNRRALRKDVDNIIDHYMENGYARVDVNPLINVTLYGKRLCPRRC
jgi:outer membrane protein insertion porin family